ncbi:hypothetical protein B566_EDAN006523 [Ephemera danica]|nr:hypothetical protein B566_EDAN006523 [Ephemera danica]
MGPLLALEGAGPEDAGLYRCAANNSGGNAGAELRLYTAELGSTAEFSCEVGPEAAVTGISWLKDGRPVAGSGGGRRLMVRPVRREDRGMYQCVARADEGATAQAAAELRLGDAPPTLLYSFIEQTLQPGPAVSLKCSATGTPTPSIRWTLDGFPLPNTDRFVMGQYVTVHGDVISHVNVSHVAVEDGGEYACIAENRAGSTIHAARLNVYGLPYVRPIPKVTAVAGETLYLKCPVAGFPIEDLPGELRQKVFANGTLAIRHVQKTADAGTYTCTARNKQGHSARRSGEVAVIVPPKINPFLVDRNYHLGERTTLTCTVIRGDSPLVISWLHDGRVLTGGTTAGVSINQVDQFNSILFIESLTPAHNGNYTCEARNEAAAATYTQRISVNVPPSIEPFSFQDGLTEGMRTRTVCGVSRGDPPITISWLKDGVPITPNSYVNVTVIDSFTRLLSIAGLLAQHSGEYTCVATNEAAKVQVSATLKVKGWSNKPILCNGR